MQGNILTREPCYHCIHILSIPHMNHCIRDRVNAYNVHVHDFIVYQNKFVLIVHGVPPNQLQKIFISTPIYCFWNVYIYIYVCVCVCACVCVCFSYDVTMHEHKIRSTCLNHMHIKFKGTTRDQKAFSYSSDHIWNFIRGDDILKPILNFAHSRGSV